MKFVLLAFHDQSLIVLQQLWKHESSYEMLETEYSLKYRCFINKINSIRLITVESYTASAKNLSIINDVLVDCNILNTFQWFSLLDKLSNVPEIYLVIRTTICDCLTNKVAMQMCLTWFYYLPKKPRGSRLAVWFANLKKLIPSLREKFPTLM